MVLKLNKKKTVSPRKEMYSNEPFKQIDPCEYWKQNGTTYPALFYRAQILLAIPASSVLNRYFQSQISRSLLIGKDFCRIELTK
jgi:hypothetical protein